MLHKGYRTLESLTKRTILYERLKTLEELHFTTSLFGDSDNLIELEAEIRSVTEALDELPVDNA